MVNLATTVATTCGTKELQRGIIPNIFGVKVFAMV